MTYVIIWLIFGIIAYSGAFADLENIYSKPVENRGIAIIFGLLGPIGFLVICLMTGFFRKGFKF